MPKDNFFSGKYSPTFRALIGCENREEENSTKFGWKSFHIRPYRDTENIWIMSMSNYIFCYVHLTYRFRVLYGWASVFPIIGSISLTSSLTITFFSVRTYYTLFIWCHDMFIGIRNVSDLLQENIWFISIVDWMHI